MAGDPAAEEAPARGRPRFLIPVIAGVVALLLAGGGVTAWWLTTQRTEAPSSSAPVSVGDDDDEKDDAPSTSTPSATPRPSATPTTPPASTVVANTEFKSQSGNLRCSVGTIEGQPGAICQQVNINYPFPAQACTTGAPGVFVAVGASGAYWPCVPAFNEPATVIAYDVPVSQNGITCAINYDTGVTCTNSKGRGFSMEYDAGVRTF